MLDTVQSAAVRLTLLGCVACGTTAALSNDVMADDDYSDLTVPSDGIINVLDIAVFESQTAEGLVRAFHKRTKTKPVGVVVPILTGRGVTFDNRLSFPVSAAKRGASNVDMPAAVQEIANAGIDDIYLGLQPAFFAFLPMATLVLVDLVGHETSQGCVAKPDLQRVVGAITSEAIKKAKAAIRRSRNRDAKLAGLMVDVIDLTPLSATDKRIEPTCFCPTCMKHLESAGVRIANLRRVPGPLNLVLREENDGLAHFDIPMSRGRAQAVEAVLQISKLRGFAADAFPDASDDQLADLAGQIYDYVEARSASVKQGIGRLLEPAKRAGLKRVVVAEGTEHAWTSGVSLVDLDDAAFCDEIWLNPSSQGTKPLNVPYRHYMARRATYYASNFYQFTSKLADEGEISTTSLGRTPVAVIRWRVHQTLGQAKGFDTLNLATLLTLPKDDRAKGYVATALTLSDEIGAKVAAKALEQFQAYKTKSGGPGAGGAEEMILEMLRQRARESSGGEGTGEKE